jgi:hypothetical protein
MNSLVCDALCIHHVTLVCVCTRMCQVRSHEAMNIVWLAVLCVHVPVRCSHQSHRITIVYRACPAHQRRCLSCDEFGMQLVCSACTKMKIAPWSTECSVRMSILQVMLRQPSFFRPSPSTHEFDSEFMLLFLLPPHRCRLIRRRSGRRNGTGEEGWADWTQADGWANGEFFVLPEPALTAGIRILSDSTGLVLLLLSKGDQVQLAIACLWHLRT